MKIAPNKEYLFQQSISKPVTSDDLNAGLVSEEIFYCFSDLTELHGSKVTVLSLHTGKNQFGCKEDRVKVFLSSEDFSWWFTTKVSNLVSTSIHISNPCKECTCDMSLIMTRGCLCGGS